MDLRAAVKDQQIIPAGATVAIPTGLMLAVPQGYEAQIRPRSGLALHHSIGIINSPGTIDSDYRGEVMILLTNFGQQDYIVRRGERIAQMVIARVERVDIAITKALPPTGRAEGGFGHSGSQ